MIFLCFGMNEAFKRSRVACRNLRKDLNGIHQNLQREPIQWSLGSCAGARLPIAHEELGVNFPNPQGEHNKKIWNCMPKPCGKQLLQKVVFHRPFYAFPCQNEAKGQQKLIH